MEQRQTSLKVQEIVNSDLPEIEKLAQVFGLYSANYIESSANQIELFSAMKDEDNLIKERIKKGMMEIARGMFSHSYRQITGRSAWDE